MTFGQVMVDLHSIPSMFIKFLVHAWRQCVNFEQRTLSIGLLRIELVLGCQEMLTCV